MEDYAEFLTEEEKKLFSLILDTAKSIKASSKEFKQIREVIPIEKWIEDEYYIGPAGMSLYPYWKKQMIDIFKADRPIKINELIITGGIGVGKSSVAIFCMIRKLYELSCYVNIPALFNMMPGSFISFMYFSVSKTQAELTGYGQLKNIIDTIPYYQDIFKRNDRLQSMLVFPENLIMMFGSSSGHAIGMNMIGSILDEANFFQNGAQNPSKSVIEHSKVAQMYTSIVNRAKSRFLGRGKDDSLSILVSSNTTASSFTEQRIKESIHSPNTKVINARLWDVKPEGTYAKERFWIFIGSDLIDPCIISGPEDIYQYTDSVSLPRVEGSISQIIESLPMEYRHRYTDVPVDFKKQYEDNIITSLQDISGISVAPSGRLFNSRPTYIEATKSNLKHPFYKVSIIISTQDNISVKDYLDKTYRPFKKSKPRFIHIDQSLVNDSTGFASSYISRYEKNKETGIWRPIVTSDILLRIDPPKAPKKISIGKVREFVYYMRDFWDLPIGWVSYDSFASEESLQELQKNDIPCGYLSVDRTDEQYMMLVNMLYNHQIETYRYQPAEEELFELIHYRDRHKVDHPDLGSKDVMDAWVGSVYNAMTHGTDETPKREENLQSMVSLTMIGNESEYTLEELMEG